MFSGGNREIGTATVCSFATVCLVFCVLRLVFCVWCLGLLLVLPLAIIVAGAVGAIALPCVHGYMVLFHVWLR